MLCSFLSITEHQSNAIKNGIATNEIAHQIKQRMLIQPNRGDRSTVQILISRNAMINKYPMVRSSKTRTQGQVPVLTLHHTNRITVWIRISRNAMTNKYLMVRSSKTKTQGQVPVLRRQPNSKSPITNRG